MTDIAQHGSVEEALHAVIAEMPAVAKEGEMTQGARYKYVQIEDIIQAARPLFIKHGLMIVPVKQSDVRHETYEVGSQGKHINRVSTVAQFQIYHVSGGTPITVETLGEGTDMGDKGSNKAMTGAFKYALMEALMIESGEDDPDHTPSSTQERARPAAPATRDEPPPPDEPPEYGEPARDVGGDVLQNRWGNPIPGPCPQHGPADVSPHKKGGAPYIDQDRNPVARCRKVYDTNKKPWEGGECWFAIPVPS